MGAPPLAPAVAVALVWILPWILVGALLYTSVGHGGATVYLAILTLGGYETAPLATTVLVLNIVAAAIAFLNFQQAGHLRLSLLVPFLVTSVPMAYVGGLARLSGPTQAVLLGVRLLVNNARFLLVPRPPRALFAVSRTSFLVIAPLVGAILGFLAGATGIGGGIFLSPVLLFLGWATVKEAGSVASAFIVLNSVAGLAAKLPSQPLDPQLLPSMLLVIVVGAVAGSLAGARRIPAAWLQHLLGAVLAVAGLKAIVG